MQRGNDILVAAPFEVGAPDAHAKQSVATEGNMLGSIVKDNAARGVARGVNDLPGVGAESDGVAVGEITAHRWHIQMDGDAQDLAGLQLHLLHEKTVVLMGPRLQSESFIDIAVAHAVVEVTVGTEQMTRGELMRADITDDGLTFFRIIGSAVDDDTIVGLVADDIAVLGEHITCKALDGKHRQADLAGEIDDMFLLEPCLAEKLADLRGLNDVFVRTRLGLQITAFQTEDAVG